MVFENENTICFLENKVNSDEGYKQLEKYAKILLENVLKEKVYLRYCTKFIDTKYRDDYKPLKENQFQQFRWADVYDFFNNYPNKDSLILAYLTYLEDNGMSKPADFKYEDLITLREISNTIQKMDEYFNFIESKFIKLFGLQPKKGLESVKQIPKHNRYAIWCKCEDSIILGGYSEILLSFDFSLTNDYSPTLNFHFFVAKNHSNYENIKKDIEDNKERLKEIILEESEYGFAGYFYKPLSDFISSPNQFQDITKWFNDKMECWSNFMCEYSSLDWKLPNKPKI